MGCTVQYDIFGNLSRKDEVLAELMEEHVALKKTAGGPSGASGSLTTLATRW